MLVFIQPARLVALDPDRSISQYNCQTWSRQQGLPASGISAISQSKDGYIWLGAGMGLVRFDGIKFTVVGMESSPRLRTTQVRCLSPARQGEVWFGLKQSAFGRFDGEGKWLLGTDPQGGADWDVPAIMESADGRLWIGGDRACVRHPDDNHMEFLFSGATNQSYVFVSSFLEDSHGRIWAGTSSRGLYRFESGEPVKFPDPDLDPNIITALTEDKAGRIWIGTQSGLTSINALGQRETVDGPGNQVQALLADSHGVLWVGTKGNGLWRYQQGKWSALHKTEGLADDNVLALMEDREGNLWIGTVDGLSELTDIKLPTFGLNEGLTTDLALSVSASPRGGVWICTPAGAARLKDGIISEVVSTNNGLSTPYVKRVLETRNRDIYVINGLNEVNVLANGWVAATHATPAMPVAMTEDAEGVVVSVGGELYRVDRNELRPYAFANDVKPQLYWIYNLATGHDGSILVASVNGICRVKDGHFEQWTQGDGLADYNARWVIDDSDGTIWAGLSTGIARIRGRKISNIGRADGLFDANINAIVPDDNGFYWVDSARGIFRVSQKTLNRVADEEEAFVNCVPFDNPSSIKLADKYEQEQSGCKTISGRVWFPGSRGAIMIDPERLHTNAIAPSVRIEEVRANGKQLHAAGRLTVPPGKGELQFQFTALSFVSPTEIRFRYQLHGYDPQWVEAEGRRLAAYNNLRPGRYRFQVIACNADGVWNETGDSIELELLPHFYETTWFLFLVTLASLGSLGAIYRWRIAVHEQREQLLETKVHERTFELTEANTSLTEEVLQRKIAQAEAEEQKARLEVEIEERKRIEQENVETHRKLLEVSRQAGQAEVASNVLHNVGNVLNSVNVSCNLISEHVRDLRVANLNKAAEMMLSKEKNLGQWITEDVKGRQIPLYLQTLGNQLQKQKESVLEEINGLVANVEHIKQIVAMQQSYARVAGVEETVILPELIDYALKMKEAGFASNHISLVREFVSVPAITLDKHKLLQILVNLINNARQACEARPGNDKRVCVRLQPSGAEKVLIAVADNGIGIPAENLTKIFRHGFTTRQNGHGFGLHSSALAAKEMGGHLSAASDGPGCGATFTLQLPMGPGKV